jgi:hypothetical protein
LPGRFSQPSLPSEHALATTAQSGQSVPCQDDASRSAIDMSTPRGATGNAYVRERGDEALLIAFQVVNVDALEAELAVALGLCGVARAEIRTPERRSLVCPGHGSSRARLEGP